MSISDELLAEAKTLDEMSLFIQDEGLPLETRQKGLGELNKRYQEWYRRGLIFLDSVGDTDGKQKFESEHDGGFFSPKILSFVTDGLKVNPLYAPENAIVPKFQYPVVSTFQQPLLKQCNYIAVAATTAKKSDSPDGEGWNRTLRRVFEAFIAKADMATANQEKKFAYEYLALFVVASIEGLKVIRQDARGSADEIDLWVANQSSIPLFHTHVGDPFIVECKNWSEPVGAKEIRSIRDIMNDKHIRFALLLSRNGVTGTDAKDATEMIKRAFMDEKKKIIAVLTHEDLLKCARGKHPAELIQEKVYELAMKS